MSFEEEIRIENRTRTEKWFRENKIEELKGEHIYTEFCVWCNCYKDNETKTNETAFRDWLNVNEKKLTFWQEKHLYEKYFGYTYNYNHKNKQWEIEKL